jgi:hypothetical protein
MLGRDTSLLLDLSQQRLTELRATADRERRARRAVAVGADVAPVGHRSPSRFVMDVIGRAMAHRGRYPAAAGSR